MLLFVPLQTLATNLNMKLVAFSYLCVTITLLLPNFVSGQEIEERTESSQGQHNDEDWRKWQSWYLSDTAVSMNLKAAWQEGYTGKGILVAVVDEGVNSDHPDLVSNFNSTASYDFLGDRKINPNRHSDSHGTKCAGIIAGGNNSKCGVGIAFDAQISSIRLFDDSTNTRSTDQLEAKSLRFKSDMIDIYSNSWGPEDMAFEVKGPGPLLREALEKGTRLGRGGKGSIFVFAAGNGGVMGDSCAFSGYVNNIHTIAISGVNWDGSVPAYTEQCAAIMAVTYGQDMFRYGKYIPPLVTTKGSNDCTERFPGSSGTAAMASGIIALALQANPELTWRDVQHLIARSAKPITPPKNLPRPTWIINAAGLKVSSDYGFGLMDAFNMVEYARNWSSVPPQLSCEVKLDVSNSSRLAIRPRGELNFALSLSQDNCSIRYLEHLQAEVNLRYSRRGDLEMVSTSPSGPQSKLLYSRSIDSVAGFKNFTNWRVTSLHYWGENPIGDWNITIRTIPRRWNTAGKGRVFGLKLILYGTKEDPLANNKDVKDKTKTKRTETVDIARRQKEIPVHGGYSKWGYWGSCSRRCGGGSQRRYRDCTNPRPENSGRDCSGLGPDRESRICNTHRCPVHGRYSEWSRWSRCSVTCSNGKQDRRRSCTNPRPAYGGKRCAGSDRQTRTCITATMCPQSGFPIDGGYSQWSSWSPCSRTCAGGTQQRSRSCTNPLPVNRGRDCSGLGRDTNSKGCNTQSCSACTNMAADSVCQQYLNNGFCSNPTVKKMCRNTCICQACTNMAADSVCQQYLNNGFCSNPSVKKMCRKTCICQACRNMAADSQCQQYFNNGHCSNTSVKKMCQKTCGSC